MSLDKPLFPDDGSQVIIPIREPFMDQRGVIQNLLDQPIGSVSVITSKKGAIRANHTHKTDAHYCFLYSGEMVYYQRPDGSQKPPQEWVIKPGMLFYTPPKHEHAMRFTQDSILIVMAKNGREAADYESDITRIDLIR
jgi:quercetin dioxygenase-like cupin family protein